MKRLIVLWSILLAALAAWPHALGEEETSLAWYYEHRFPVYVMYEPERHEAIMAAVKDAPQQASVREGAMSLAVTEYAWAPKARLLVIAMKAEPNDPQRYELHPMINLDADGAYLNGECPPSLEDYMRSEHWLWTESGYGPVQEMIASGKQLLLLNACEVWLGDCQLLGDGSGWDAYVTEDGVMYTVMEIRLDAETVDLVESQAVNGCVALTIPYTLTAYTEDDEALYHGGHSNKITIEVALQ